MEGKNKYSRKVVTLLCFIVIFFQASCRSIKIIESSIPFLPSLNGKVEKMEVLTIELINDTVVERDTMKVFYDSRNRVFKTTELGSETQYYYQKGMLESKIHFKFSDSKVIREKFKYDKAGNQTEFRQLFENELYLVKTSLYDSKNNVTSVTYDRQGSLERMEYTYKYNKKYYVVQGYNHNNVREGNYLKFQFDKKGNVAQVEFIYPDSKFNRVSQMEFDIHGNCVKRTYIDEHGIESITKYEYTYEKQGNVRVRNTYFNNKLIEKTEYNIIYLE